MYSLVYKPIRINFCQTIHTETWTMRRPHATACLTQSTDGRHDGYLIQFVCAIDRWKMRAMFERHRKLEYILSIWIVNKILCERCRTRRSFVRIAYSLDKLGRTKFIQCFLCSVSVYNWRIHPRKTHTFPIIFICFFGLIQSRILSNETNSHKTNTERIAVSISIFRRKTHRFQFQMRNLIFVIRYNSLDIYYADNKQHNNLHNWKMLLPMHAFSIYINARSRFLACGLSKKITETQNLPLEKQDGAFIFGKRLKQIFPIIEKQLESSFPI